MKKSVEIIGLPIISITEGRELGMSKSLLIDAKNGKVAAITIKDQDWYRGVKLLPYESVIAIGEDAVTITSSDSILTLEDAGDYENMLDDNIRVIGTKAITRSGTIEGCVSEIFVGDNGKIEKCEITKKDDSKDEVTANQISIFGKQVTVIDPDNEEKKTVIPEQPAPTQPAPTQQAAPQAVAPQPAAPQAAPQAHDNAAEEKAAEEKAKAEKEAAEKKAAEEKAKAEKEAAEKKAAEEKAKAEKEAAEKKAAEEKAKAEKEAAEKKAAEEKAKAEKEAAEKKQPAGQHSPADKAAEDRRRRFLLGKKAARRITTDNGIVIVEAGADITEEVLQKAKLANKFIELSMNIQ